MTQTVEAVSILVVDDEPAIRDSLTSWFEEDGFDVESAEDARAALSKLDARRFDIVLLDIKMPGMDGMELLKRIRAAVPDVIVIMITAFASVETAVQALKDGAFDYVTKPFDPDDLNRLIRNAIRQRALTLENKALKAGIEALIQVDEIVGDSPAIRRVLDLVATVSGTDATVLVRGETGTGKELIARAVHVNSPRRYFPIITMNCGAVPDSLLESELFGHERGAFTGASHRRKGKLELANGGTLFLDEIGNVSARMQMELLRVLETKRFARVGGAAEVEVDFRLVCATNSDLEAAVREGRFREDLYYRINVFRIDLPPLRARQGDIALLAQHFVKSFRRAMGKDVTGITEAGKALLAAYPWPGNVRELRNVIERAMVVCPGGQIDVDHLRYQFPLVSVNGAAAANGFGSGVEAASVGGDEPEEAAPWTAGDSLADIERVHIERVLKAQGGNISATARVLGVDRVTLYNKLKKYGIDRQ
ncbi:MAG: Fis family transcriptional regulator [Deltaproteobacteria bacterium HGW-Deltaproteobacteria-14]|jgi:DNA-binding NtrC family response regulator|nr:MAG: Fis family transcriptional regulator [Deltaproteobacteria bacterium HGW-Deltaproteobacteria-14]